MKPKFFHSSLSTEPWQLTTVPAAIFPHIGVEIFGPVLALTVTINLTFILLYFSYKKKSLYLKLKKV
jgi:hypothetical protein